MENTEEIRNLPQNLIRKAFALQDCIIRLERLQKSYQPIFEDDKEIYELLYHLHSKQNKLIAQISKYPEHDQMYKNKWKESQFK